MLIRRWKGGRQARQHGCRGCSTLIDVGQHRAYTLQLAFASICGPKTSRLCASPQAASFQRTRSAILKLHAEQAVAVAADGSSGSASSSSSGSSRTHSGSSVPAPSHAAEAVVASGRGRYGGGGAGQYKEAVHQAVHQAPSWQDEVALHFALTNEWLWGWRLAGRTVEQVCVWFNLYFLTSFS